MALPTEKTNITKNVLESTFFIYGEPKIGKTVLASKMDDPLFLATERGHDYVEVYKVDAATWEVFKTTARSVLQEKHNFRTIIIDTVSEAFEMCARYVYVKEDFSHMSELDGGRGYDLVKAEFAKVITPLTLSRFGVVFIGHEKLVKSTFQGIEKSRYWPNMMKTGRDVLIPKVDHIGRMFTKAVVADGMTSYQRHISFQNNPDYEAGSRFLSGFGDICVEPELDCWKNVKSCFDAS